ncbi:twin-arginine translocase TatA/TatE family subunit [Streptomyces sp. NPDC052114]|uniref:twin-arginine translocase TatA/TatE family subunit n=1 Tax=unclassified Streptomyces TaxID=2593676 RepID=UPI0034446C3D
MFGLSEIAIILIVVIVVFGAKKLPELARSAGKSARILKAEAKAMKKADPAADPDGRTASPGTEGRVVEGRVVQGGAAQGSAADARSTAPDDPTGWPPPRH